MCGAGSGLRFELRASDSLLFRALECSGFRRVWLGLAGLAAAPFPHQFFWLD